MALTISSVSLTLLVVFAVSRVQKLFNGIRATGNIPGFRIPFQPYSLPGVLIKTSWWNPGREAVWRWRKFMYKQFNNDTISAVPFIMGRSTVYTANLEVAKQIMAGSHKAAFAKLSMKELGPVTYWGNNLLIADGDIWKKHRRIVAPAFSQKLNELVWSESLDLYRQMISAEGFDDKEVVELTAAQHITFKFSFYIIGRCGFDLPFNWGENSQSTDGRMSFTEAMRFFFDNIQLLHLPKSVLALPVPKFKKLKLCLFELRQFMDNKIAEKERVIKSQQWRNDIFSMLVQANLAEENSKVKLDYDELISDIFLMFFAGHETTGHNMAATVACLAKFPDQQQEVFEQIMSVVGTDRDPTYDDLPKLNKVQAVFYEALRTFPTVYVTIRKATEDTVLNVPNSIDGDEYTTHPILKDTRMVIDMVGIQRNPRYYEEPDVYRASRWYDVSNESDASPGFGLGPRACIGRKFAVTEAVCFLTMLLRDWKIEPLLNPGESADEWFEKLSTESTALVTFSLGKIPVRFVRRS